MKKIILNFEKKTNNFKALIQEALNMNLLNILVSKETRSELKQVERINTFSKDTELPVKNLIFKNLEHLKSSKKLEANRGIILELTIKADEQKVIELSKINEVDFIIVSAKDWKIIPFENLIAKMLLQMLSIGAEMKNNQRKIRQGEGIRLAQMKHIYSGRKKGARTSLENYQVNT